MGNVLHIVVCAGIVPDPLQTLEPVTSPAGPGLKNEMVLPAVLDPWAASALYEAASLAAKNPGSKLWLVSLGPKAKLQQVMMTIAQKVAFEREKCVHCGACLWNCAHTNIEFRAGAGGLHSAEN